MMFRTHLLAVAALAITGCCQRDECASCTTSEAAVGDAGDIGFIDAFPPLDLGGSCPLERILWAGADPVIDVFVSGERVLVVHEQGVDAVDAYGTVVAHRDQASPVQTAAFDGSVLVVTDKAQATRSGPELSAPTTIPLVAPCAGSLLVSGNRLVCETGENMRPVRVYDLDQGTVLSQGGLGSGSKPYRIRRVPGTDDLVARDGGQFQLFHVDSATHEVQHVCDSAILSYTDANDVYAFDKGAVNLITQMGTRRTIVASACPYFVENGALAAMVGNEYFIEMDDDGQGQIVGLIGTDTKLVCSGTCILEKIDTGADVVVGKRPLALRTVEVGRARYDSPCGGLLVAYRDEMDFYRVIRLGLQ